MLCVFPCRNRRLQEGNVFRFFVCLWRNGGGGGSPGQVHDQVPGPVQVDVGLPASPVTCHVQGLPGQETKVPFGQDRTGDNHQTGQGVPPPPGFSMQRMVHLLRSRRMTSLCLR